MADPSLDHDEDTAAPRWVKVSGAVFVVLLLLFGILHLAGGGFRGHGHAGPTPPSAQQP